MNQVTFSIKICHFALESLYSNNVALTLTALWSIKKNIDLDARWNSSTLPMLVCKVLKKRHYLYIHSYNILIIHDLLKTCSNIVPKNTFLTKSRVMKIDLGGCNSWLVLSRYIQGFGLITGLKQFFRTTNHKSLWDDIVGGFDFEPNYYHNTTFLISWPKTRKWHAAADIADAADVVRTDTYEGWNS